ncbi:proteasome subunit beta type-2-A-like protein [Tanacetum coccineum]|uniref:Proteasome subunit beta type-2-A-like protein n=1 Tax=Tanacetum coccineum TaxID=301880 RepID=A0ABQ4YER9_9ASTR
MECVFGMVGKDFALVVADTSAVNSILVHKSNEDKIMLLDPHKLMGASGEAGDRFDLISIWKLGVFVSP